MSSIQRLLTRARGARAAGLFGPCSCTFYIGCRTPHAAQHRTRALATVLLHIEVHDAPMLPVHKRLPVKILPQPDETTCGPTCLHAIYRYWGEDEALPSLIERMWHREQGGTYAVFLGC